MRVHFDNVNFGSTSGPNTFANRLARGLFESGHEVLEASAGADASLVFIEPSGAPLASRVVQRLDGVWFSPSEFHTKNAAIKRLYDVADAVVFQSEFDKSFVTRWWGSKPGAVIGNGISLLPVERLTLGLLIEMRQRYKTMFCCSSNWHAQKRLAANLELFYHLNSTCCPNSCLIIMGHNPDKRSSHPHVFYAGSESHDVCAEVYSACNWMLHLAWLDHCPNVVVEALAQGTPVICSEAGGTKELVGGYGLVLKEAKEYDYSLVEYDKPPAIDVKQVSSLPPKATLGAHGDIDIKNVVKKYVSLLQENT